MAMYYRTFFPRDLFAEVSRLQREMMRTLDPVHSIRGLAHGYPALNVGSTPAAVDVYAFVPGLDPAGIDLQIERGVLAIAGERKAEGAQEKSTRHIDERFAGRFRRVVALPDDVDAGAVQARYRDGVLHVHIPRKKEAQPQRIAIQ